MFFKSRISYSIVVYVMSMMLVFLTKPEIAFDRNGDLKNFGVSQKNDTIYSVGVMAVTLAIVVFYTFCMIDLVFD